MLLFRPLVWVGRDATMDADRSLAASVQPLDGNTRFRVTLKPWRWSDTTPVTSDDVVYYWERIQILGGLYAYAGQGGIPDQVQAVRPAGQGAIDFVLKAAVNPAWFTLNGLSTIYALPRHAWGNLGRDEMWRRQNDPTLARVVDGPFKLEKFRDDRYAVYTPNPLYGGHPSRLARLVVTFLEGDNPLHAVQAGEADIARVPYALWDRVRQTPGYDFTVLPEPYGYAAIMPNLRRPAVAFLQDVRVRRALAKAVDQAAMIRLLYRGLAAENHVPIPAGATAWRSPQSRAGNPDLAYDPAAAAALLAQAGWAAGADGVLTHAGARMEFTILSAALSDDATEMQLLQVLQHSLKRLGIVMSIHRVSLDQFFEILGGPAGGWDAAIVANTNNAVPDGSGFFDTGGANNFGGYTNPHMDDLIHTSISGVGNQALFAYQDYAAAELPWIVVPQGRFPVMVRRRLRGVEEMSNPLGFWSPEYLWVDDRNGQTGEGREQCDLVAGEAMR
jgi:peptide/nickel transport system substrate-binding protein